VQHFLDKTPLAYPVVMGDTALAKLYGGVLGLPLTYLIDAHGKIVARYLGGTDVKTVETRIKRMLAQ
jgi:cytochrome c biogenesis protein CcmG/thiol:disulfide interchange protein DsbE